MCGIYGHIRKQGKNSITACIEGLRRLEYRGYDSAGLAGIHQGAIVVFKTTGKVQALDLLLQKENVDLEAAIAHTRWATHGGVTHTNAHPHFDSTQSIALVHNGIIENYQDLKTDLNVPFVSETDTEVLSQLLAHHYKGDLASATQATLQLLKGSFAFAYLHKDHPNTIVAAARGCPLAVGVCHTTSDVFISSDSNAFVGTIMDVFYLSDGEYVIINDTIQVYHGTTHITKPIEVQKTDPVSVSKGAFPHFLLKEIHDQPMVIETILQEPLPPMLSYSRVLIIACGSSYHAGCIAKHFFSVPVDVEIASEFRYSNHVPSNDTLVIAISQSGETADTLAALERLSGVPILALCNVKNSSLTRLATHTVYLKAGPEISVCSTKAFLSQLVWLLRIAGHDASSLPKLISSVLERSEEIKRLAIQYASFKNFFFIGRSAMYASCLEAALKLKEISYVHASGYPAGEMKHGPIALISPELATVAFCGNERTLDKVLSNIMEIKARGGPVLAFSPVPTPATDTLILPSLPDHLAPVPYSVVGQLFAYYLADALGTDIDQPRNLAKSVTVE